MRRMSAFYRAWDWSWAQVGLAWASDMASTLGSAKRLDLLVQGRH